MGELSKIEWTEKTWNPIVGCSVVSPGCTHCYAMGMAARIERMNPDLAHYRGLTKEVKGTAVWTGKLNLAPEHILLEPLHRKKPTMWFVNSMSDLFHENVPDEWIDRVFEVMDGCGAGHSIWDGERWHPRRRHTFQILTKRSGRMRDYMLRRYAKRKEYADKFKGCPTPEMRDSPAARHARQMCDPEWDNHIWLGVSCEDQRRADERIPDLLATPAAVRFISAEPLLGPISFMTLEPDQSTVVNALHGGTKHLDDNYQERSARLDWVIVGGESGPEARPTHPEWARGIRDQCTAAGVAFFFKQHGSWLVGEEITGADHSTYVAFQDSDEFHVVSDGHDIVLGAAQDEIGGPKRIWGRFGGWKGNLVKWAGKKAAGRLLDGRTWDEMPVARTQRERMSELA